MRVKINTVALKNFNENELFSITDWCSSKGLDLTFIEVMPMGELEKEDRKSQYWSLKDLRNKLEENYSLHDLEENTGGLLYFPRDHEVNNFLLVCFVNL